MSCNRQCFDKNDKWFEHQNCSTCSGKDDGASVAETQFRFLHWAPHALTQPQYQKTEVPL